MQLIYNNQEFINNKSSIFLAGPSYRTYKEMKQKSWRNQAISLLSKYNFDGIIVIPQYRDSKSQKKTFDRKKQIQWQTQCLSKCDLILFWIPRNLKTLPGFTTNIEFGQWMHSDKIIIGSPNNSEKNSYLQERCNMLNIQWHSNLEQMVKNSINVLNRPSKAWFISDTHFGQQRTFELSRRPFKSLTEMDQTLINNWNKKVKSYDIVFHLGDFGEPEFIQYLNGIIYLISGGYDDRYDSQQFINQIKKYKPNIRLIKQNYKIKIKDGEYLKLIHIPEHGQDDGEDFFCYAHVHYQKFKRNGVNVGVDCNNYCPIDLDTVLFFRDAVLKFYDNNVFMEKI